jgi:hypothetical protein
MIHITIERVKKHDQRADKSSCMIHMNTERVKKHDQKSGQVMMHDFYEVKKHDH